MMYDLMMYDALRCNFHSHGHVWHSVEQFTSVHQGSEHLVAEGLDVAQVCNIGSPRDEVDQLSPSPLVGHSFAAQVNKYSEKAEKRKDYIYAAALIWDYNREALLKWSAKR